MALEQRACSRLQRLGPKIDQIVANRLEFWQLPCTVGQVFEENDGELAQAITFSNVTEEGYVAVRHARQTESTLADDPVVHHDLDDATCREGHQSWVDHEYPRLYA